MKYVQSLQLQYMKISRSITICKNKFLIVDLIIILQLYIPYSIVFILGYAKYLTNS